MANNPGINGHNGVSQWTTSGVRIPSVQEALPFSPFSTVVPFSPDILPAPFIYPSTAGPILSLTQRPVADRMLEDLNAQASSAARASDRLQRTLKDLQNLIKPEHLTTYRFRKPNRFATDSTSSNLGRPNLPTGSPRQSHPQLNPFAKMLFESRAHSSATLPTKSAKAEVRDVVIPLPISRVSSMISPQQSTTTPHPRTITAETPPRSQDIKKVSVNGAAPSTLGTDNVPAYINDSQRSLGVHEQISSVPSAPKHESQQQSSQSRKEIAIVIPRSQHSSQQAQHNASYVTTNGITGHAQMPDSGHPEKYEQLTSAALDQREKANVAISKLQNLITEILEAEDQMQPDTSGFGFADSDRFFLVDDFADPENPRLQPAIQVQLDSFLQKVASIGCLPNVAADNLSRIQRLCENAIAAASTLDYRIDDDTEQDLPIWINRINIGEQALNASKTLLRIMTAGREEKQLYSEDTLRGLLNFLSHLVETCIIPIIELRSGTIPFKIASDQSKVLLPVLAACTRVLKLLGDLMSSTDVDESAITTVEFICKTLVFVENATSEKDSALGIQKFEVLRRTAMDVLARIFARYPEQRQFICDEILTSLEKLPVGRQSARQFKMVDAKPIQLVSALLIRLVQTSATRSQGRKSKITQEKPDEHDGQDENSESDSEDETADKRPSSAIPQSQTENLADIQSLVNPLYDAASKNAAYMVNFLLQRAMTSTKTGDQPYRNLLDIFTEDFLSVLGNTDWPAAEMLLRVMLSRLLELIDSSKSTAPAKSMALELMGSMASRITEVRLGAQQAARRSNTEESDITTRLLETHESIVNDEVSEHDLLAFDGPYRIVIEYLQLRNNGDSQIQTACGYHAMQWAKHIMSIKETSTMTLELEKRLARLLANPNWLEEQHEFPTVSTEDGRFASALITMYMPFCRAFNHIFTKILNAMAGDQASLRSKSLKSIEQLIEMDPTILDRNNFVINSILRCLLDTSTQVRDSALGLTVKCLALRPKLDTEVYERIILRANDSSVHVRKRAMKMLKDIYLRNSASVVRSRIADALVRGVADVDDTVIELARQTLEEIWMAPFYLAAGAPADSLKRNLQLREQTSLIIHFVQQGRSDKTEAVLVELLQGIFSDKSKSAKANFGVCCDMIKSMFDAIIDSTELPEKPSEAHVLQTLAVFARANATLFTAAQLQTLQPYVQNLSTNDNLLVYRYAIAILRYTLPTTKNLNKDFLTNIQTALFSSFQKLPKPELKEVALCLWMLDGELKNTERLVRIVISVLQGIKQCSSSTTDSDQAAATKVQRLLKIAGPFCKTFDLNSYASSFKEKFPNWKGSDIASLAVDIVCPFTSPKQTAAVREEALDTMGQICQAWPSQLMRTDVCNAIELVFQSQEPRMVSIMINGLKDFFFAGDKPTDGSPAIPLGAGVAAGTERLGKTYLATDRDGAATSIAQRFLKDIIRVTLASADDLAFDAAQVVASINRQGLVHPKESGPCFVALETCPENRIASIAFQEHHTLYHKHETMFEKEHMQSIQQAFEYQRTVIKDTLGYTGTPPVAKLHMFWEVLKTGQAKIRKKFLASICRKMDFEPARFDTSTQSSPHVEMVRFCTENLAFFDYTKLDELQHLVSCLDKVIADTGTGISHNVETEILKLSLGNGTSAEAAVVHDTDDTAPDTMTAVAPILQIPSIAPQRLQHLATCAQVLCLMWELRTYLRRLWNISKPASAKPKAGSNSNVKDATRAPQRVPNSTKLTEHFLTRNATIASALTSPETQRNLCGEFAHFMAIDADVRVPNGDEDDDAMVGADGGYETPSEGGSVRSGSVPGSATQAKRGRKRKSGGDVAGETPKKKRGRKAGSVSFARGTSRDADGEGWD